MSRNNNLEWRTRHSKTEHARFKEAVSVWKQNPSRDLSFWCGDYSQCVRLAVKEWCDRILSGSSSSCESADSLPEEVCQAFQSRVSFSSKVVIEIENGEVTVKVSPVKGSEK